MKKYLMTTAAVVLVGMTLTGCSHDLDAFEEKEKLALENAQSTLGFIIPADQDWVMTQAISANLPITGEAGETYTVKVYSNNPKADGIGYYTVSQEVTAGQTFVANFRSPSYLKSLVVGVADSKGRTKYMTAPIVDGKITYFSDEAKSRMTRSGLVTRGTFPNANEWAATYLVPDPLTALQKDIVRQYFQQNTGLSYTSPGWTDYFIQQVYKGGTNTTGTTSEKKEKYTSANNGTVTGSNHMDHLEAVYDDGTGRRDHIYNFNYGDCSTNYNVQNNGTAINDASQHADKIQLMVNSTTDLFGYFNSDGSIGHTDYTGLVSWQTIRDWANDNGLPGDSLDDGWNRSFMGFDFEQIVGDDIYAHTNEDSLNAEGHTFLNGKGQIQKKLRYFTYGDMQSMDGYVWDGTSTSPYPDPSTLVLFNGEPVPMLVDNTNEYCGLNGDFDQNQLRINKSVLLETGHTQDKGCLNMEKVYEMLEADYLPVINGQGAKWVKVQGGADGYFSDWIVTLTEAKEVNIPDEGDIWTYAFEDNTTENDYDMNDVVIQVQEVSNNRLKIKLVAAGCQYENRIMLGEDTIYFANNKCEVHDVLKVGKGVLVNTGNRSVTVPAVTTYIDKPSGYDPQTADFSIVPSGGDMKGQQIKIATSGYPCGMAFPCKWAWPKEIVNVGTAYPFFAGWGSRATTDNDDWYNHPEDDLVIKP